MDEEMLIQWKLFVREYFQEILIPIIENLKQDLLKDLREMSKDLKNYNSLDSQPELLTLKK